MANEPVVRVAEAEPGPGSRGEQVGGAPVRDAMGGAGIPSPFQHEAQERPGHAAATLLGQRHRRAEVGRALRDGEAGVWLVGDRHAERSPVGGVDREPEAVGPVDLLDVVVHLGRARPR